MVIWLYGADSFRSRLKLKEFKDKYLKEVDQSGNSLLVLDGESLDMAKFNEAVSAPSLFARKRLIVVERLFVPKTKELRKKMAEFFKAYKDEADGNIIIFWDDISAEGNKSDPLFKFLESAPVKQEFKSLSATQAQEWVRERIKKWGGQIRVEAARHLVALAGVDLWALDNEARKLVNYKESQKLVDDKAGVMIEAADVDALVKGSLDENIFALTDAISQKNKARAMELLENEAQSGVADTYLLHMIIRQFRILLQVKAALDMGYNNRKIQNELKLHPFVVTKAVNQVRHFEFKALKDIFGALARLDRRIKTGQSELKLDLNILFAYI